MSIIVESSVNQAGYFGVAEPPIRSVLSDCLAEYEPLFCWLNQYLYSGKLSFRKCSA